MRNISYLACALGCWGLTAVPMACSSSKGGVEGDSTGGTGAYVNVGGSGAVGGTDAVGGVFFGQNTSTGTETGGTRSLDTECGQHQVPIKPAIPDILIVMDQSLSMTWDRDGGTCGSTNPLGTGDCGTESRWYKTITAVQAVVSATQTKVNWGLFYLGNEATQCGVATAPAVPITPGESYPLIEQSFAAVQFTGQPGTPTAGAVRNAANYLRTVADDNPKYLLLATDGEPNCAGGNNLMLADADGAANAVANARTQGMDTFVIGIATSTDEDATNALNQAAQAGGHPQQGAATEYYSADDTATLEAALTEIVSIAMSCTISLADTPQGEWEIAISATNPAGDTVQVLPDAENGWAFSDTSRTSITLVGTACESLKNGDYKDFNFVYTCKGHDFVW